MFQLQWVKGEYLKQRECQLPECQLISDGKTKNKVAGVEIRSEMCWSRDVEKQTEARGRIILWKNAHKSNMFIFSKG